MGKNVLDATCGSRMMWFDKNDSRAVFMDQRIESHTLCDGRVLDIKPDVVSDFTNMTFDDNTFSLVVFDPPHLVRAGDKSWMKLKYGRLPKDWQPMILDGFNECMRVLKRNGVLIFKWNETQVKTSDVVKILPIKPLFGHPTGQNGKTIWMTFMKD